MPLPPYTPPQEAGGLSLARILVCFLYDCMFSQAISMFQCFLPLLAWLPACLAACLQSLARIRCRLAGLACQLPRFRDDELAATLCVRRATPCSCLTIRERGRERKGKGGRDRERGRGREGGERESERERAAWQEQKKCLNGIRMADWLFDCPASWSGG